MNLPNETGTYIAAPAEWGINESGDKKTPTFICRFNLLQFFNAGEWQDVSHDQMEITGYFYVIKKDGQPNNFTIKALKDSLGWDGRGLAALADSDWSQTEVQVVVGREEYQGKPKIKVQFINPRDSVPGGGAVEKAAPEVIQSLDAKYGPLLRAINGAAPAKAAATKPAAAPKTSAPVNGDAKKDAWGKFLAKWSEHLSSFPDDAPKKNDRWKGAVAEHFGAKEVNSISQEEWKAFAGAIESDYDAATGGFLPF